MGCGSSRSDAFGDAFSASMSDGNKSVKESYTLTMSTWKGLQMVNHYLTIRQIGTCAGVGVHVP